MILKMESWEKCHRNACSCFPQPWKLEQRNLCFPQPSTDFSSSVLACSILISARMLSTCSSNFLLLYTSSCFSVSSDGVAEFFLSRAWHLKRWIFHEEKPSFVTPVASAQIPKGLKIHSVLGLQDLWRQIKYFVLCFLFAFCFVSFFLAS